jgi:hypothetical protein
MKPNARLFSGMLLVCGYSTAHAQDDTSVAETNLAIPIVKIGPATAPTPAPPKITGFAEIIRAKYPLAIKFSELGVGWRVIESGTTYFTKGETTILNNEEYLVAYLAQLTAAPTRKLETREYIRTITVGAAERRYEAEDRFPLTLLKMASIWQIATDGRAGLRSFNPELINPETGASKFNPPLGSPAYRQALSLLYLAKINEAVNAYTSMYLGVMPPTDSAFAVRQALLPFAENDAIFFQAGTNTPFKVNPLFSERKREHLRGKGRLVLFYEALPSADGMRAVLLYGGTARRVDAKAWERLRKASQID